MCGLVGMAGNIAFNDEKLFRTLLILDSLRGEHSTGAAAVGKWNNDTRLAKQVGGPFDLFETKKFEEIMQKSSRVLIGHNRYATSGAVSRTNAHPFEFDTLIGVHNGTLTNKHALADADRFKVDSENLYHHIEKHGLDDAIKTAQGAWALVWWDKVMNTLNFLRNKERTLFYCWNEKQDTVYWASEGWMLDIALWRNGTKRGEIKAFEEDTHYSIEIKDKGDIGKPVLRRCAAPERGYLPATSTTKPLPVQNTSSDNASVAGGTGRLIVLKGKAARKAALRQKQQEKELKKVDGEKALDMSYLSKKGVRLELMAVCMDIHGNRFLSCFDPIHQGKRVRLYYRRDSSLINYIGEEVIGTIQAGSFEEGNPIYKVDPWTVKLAMEVDDVNDKMDDIKDCTDVCEIDPAASIGDGDVADDYGKVETMYPTHKQGVFVNETEWYKRYDNCSYCGLGVMATDANAFTRDGDCICPGCIENASQITSLIKPSALVH